MKKLIAFPYYGGKNLQLSWLLSKIPYDISYVEPFGGSMAVLLNRKRFPIEVYNDIDKEVVNFFQVLRDHGNELISKLMLTPYSKYEHTTAREPIKDPIERARRFFVYKRQTFMSNSDGDTWAISPKQTRNGISQVLSRWLACIPALLPIVNRLRFVELDYRPAIEVIEKWDTPNTVFYLDPPYPRESRSSKIDYYTHDMKLCDHKELLEALQNIKGRVALSTYENNLYAEELEGWFLHKEPIKGLAGRRGTRQELLYCNYDPNTVITQNQTKISDFRMGDYDESS